ncbi:MULTISPECIES: competence type IV pilus minor pilin ComGD [Bacillaceae]|uniref:competence type IV pilus minor pilin ComGD n=1 Tax=Bacillaceae TaxID=186817 RepID=UPI001189A90A|nr:competence type IV pilus minor pilin ComGD [Bacillus sp. S3]QCJ43454.1 type II secretion system protein [Bacillus sp. S3]
MDNREKGFTLIESLVVFSIFMIISSITVFFLKPQHTVMEDKVFLTQLQADLLYAQQYAISHQHEVSVTFQPNNYQYYMITRSDHPAFLVRKYSSKVLLREGSIPLYFKFLSDGNVNRFGTILIYTPKKNYKLTVLIGKGRFYVAEQ